MGGGPFSNQGVAVGESLCAAHKGAVKAVCIHGRKGTGTFLILFKNPGSNGVTGSFLLSHLGSTFTVR